MNSKESKLYFHQKNTTSERYNQYANLFEGLSEMHRKKYLFTDIKTENIMISKRGKLKFIDFGMVTKFNKAKKAESGSDFFNSPQKNNIFNILEFWKEPEEKNQEYKKMNNSQKLDFLNSLGVPMY